MLLFAGTIIDFQGPNWDQDPVTKALPRSKKASASGPVEVLELTIVIILNISMLHMAKENSGLKNENIATCLLSMSLKVTLNLHYLSRTH